MVDNAPPVEAPELRPEIILIVDDSERFLSHCRRALQARGFHNIRTAADFKSAMDLVDTLKPDLILLDIHLDNGYDGLEILHSVRRLGFRGIVVVVSGDSSKEQCFRAAKAGASDFLLKTPNISIADEVQRVLDQKKEQHAPLAPPALSDLGYLRSFGLTLREIEILESFAIDFPAQKIVADRLNTAPVQLRKAFGRIYKKIGVDSLSQLVHVLTVCSMFHRH